MSKQFAGRLTGSLSDDVAEPLAGAQVRVYRLAGGRSAPEAVAPLPDEVVERKEALLLAEARTDGEGGFQLELAEQEQVEVDVRLAAKGGPPRQFTVAQVDAAALREGRWEHRIPTERWTSILPFLGRVIFGKVTVCGTEQGVSGLKVSAFDSDCVQDDPLGSATTGPTGNYVIFYTEAAYKRTPLSPVVNLDTPIFGNAGPDVYFRIENPATGDVLVDEPSSRGRQDDRDDVPAIFRADLCVPRTQQDPPVQVETKPMFEYVGVYSVFPADGDFTPAPAAAGDPQAGLTTAGLFAFTGGIPLKGIVPDGSAATPMKYRFLAQEYASADGTGAPGASVVLTGTHIGKTEIGKLVYQDFNPVTNAWTQRSTPYYAGAADNPQVTIHRPAGFPFFGDVTVSVNTPVGSDGWIEVPRENDLSFGGLGRFEGGDVLARLNTAALTSELIDLTTPAPGLKAGDPVPLAKRTRAHVFRISFEAKNVDTDADLPGNALEHIALINAQYRYERHPNWAGGEVVTAGVVSLNVAETLLGIAGNCGKVNDEVHTTFTVYHPFIRQASVSFEGPVPVAGAVVALDADGHAVSPDVPDPGIDGQPFDLTGKPNCAYVAWLSALLDLSDGDGRIADPHISDHVAFCKG